MEWYLILLLLFDLLIINISMQANSASDNLYVVESIIGKKVEDNKVYYKVKWQGYSERECTWEKLSHLRYVPDLVEEYEKNCSIDTSKSSLGTSEDTSQSDAAISNDPTLNDKEPTHESIK
jgi:hypothetical protein